MRFLFAGSASPDSNGKPVKQKSLLLLTFESDLRSLKNGLQKRLFCCGLAVESWI
jgi:hypothetical protein